MYVAFVTEMLVARKDPLGALPSPGKKRLSPLAPKANRNNKFWQFPPVFSKLFAYRINIFLFRLIPIPSEAYLVRREGKKWKDKPESTKYLLLRLITMLS